MPKTFTSSFFLFIFPALEVVFARQVIHRVIGLRIGFHSMTDYDFLLPVPFAYFLLMFVLQQQEVLRLKWRPQILRKHLLILGMFFLFSTAYATLRVSLPTLTFWIWVSLLAGVVISAVASLTPLSYFLKHPSRVVILPCVGIALSVWGYNNFFVDLWKMSNGPLSASLKFVTEAVLGSRVQVYVTGSDYLKIEHAAIALRIGRGCGGIDAFFLFFSLCLVLGCVKRKWHSVSHWFLFVILGFAWAFALNVLRILIVLTVGIVSHRLFGYSSTKIALVQLSHANAGWFIYGLGFYTYFKIFSLFTAPRRVSYWNLLLLKSANRLSAGSHYPKNLP